MTQTWENLLFAHWPISPDAMRQVVPPTLELDTYDGKAWLGIVPFDITNFRPRSFPRIRGTSRFAELNVRTYVMVDGKPGVYFFSLDAANIPAVIGARIWFSLPYFFATMSIQRLDNWAHYSHRRLAKPAAEWRGSYHPTGPITPAAPGSLDEWLTERYALYAVTARKHVLRGEIHHLRWPLQPAELQLKVNKMAVPVRLPDVPPLLHYAHRLDVLMWPPYRVV